MPSKPQIVWTGRSGDMLTCPVRCTTWYNLAGGNLVSAWWATVRPSPAAVLGATVGAGDSDATGCLTVRTWSGWMNDRVGGLVVPPPPSAQARALNPFFATR